MAKVDPLRCELITPDRLVLDVEATSVVFPVHDGEMGVLKNRAPLLCKLGVGTCRIKTGDEAKRYYVAGGFARMLANRLTILTEDARAPDEIDRTAVEQELDQARTRPAPTLAAQEERSQAIRRAKAMLKVARG